MQQMQKRGLARNTGCAKPYGVNNNGQLTVINYGQGASATATAFIDAAIAATTTYGVTSNNGSPVIFAEADTSTNQITFD